MDGVNGNQNGFRVSEVKMNYRDRAVRSLLAVVTGLTVLFVGALNVATGEHVAFPIQSSVVPFWEYRDRAGLLLVAPHESLIVVVVNEAFIESMRVFKNIPVGSIDVKGRIPLSFGNGFSLGIVNFDRYIRRFFSGKTKTVVTWTWPDIGIWEGRHTASSGITPNYYFGGNSLSYVFNFQDSVRSKFIVNFDSWLEIFKNRSFLFTKVS